MDTNNLSEISDRYPCNKTYIQKIQEHVQLNGNLQPVQVQFMCFDTFSCICVRTKLESLIHLPF